MSKLTAYQIQIENKQRNEKKEKKSGKKKKIKKTKWNFNSTTILTVKLKVPTIGDLIWFVFNQSETIFKKVVSISESLETDYRKKNYEDYNYYYYYYRYRRRSHFNGRHRCQFSISI